MVSEGATYRKLSVGLGADRARVLTSLVSAVDRAIAQSAIGDSFMGHELFPALTILYAAARDAVEKTVASERAPQEDRTAAQSTLVEMDLVLFGMQQDDPNPPPPVSPRLFGPDMLQRMMDDMEPDTDPNGGLDPRRI